MKKKAQPKGCKQIGFRKKGQIGTIMTWAVAFTIVLFLMIVFIIITGALSKTKSSGENEINLEESAENLNSQRELMKILNSPVEVNKKEMSVQEAIKFWFFDREKYAEVLEKEMKKVLDGFEYEYVEVETVKVRGFRVAVFLDEKELFEARSERFELGFCIIDLFGGCENLAGVYILMSDSTSVYVVIQGSQGAKDV